MKSLIFLILFSLLLFSAISAEVPQLINYQGRLTDTGSNPVADGPYLIKFIIYDDLGTEIWNSQYQTVQVAGGFFNVNLGESPMPALPNDLFEDTIRYLGVTVGTDDEITPRTRLISSGYAYHALRADTADFITGGPYLKRADDTLMGYLYFGGSGGHFDVEYGFANLMLTDNGTATSRLYGEDHGKLTLHDPAGGTTVLLDATDFMGGKLVLSDASNLEMIGLDGGASGDDAVVFPTGAVNAGEIYNESGIAWEENSGNTLLSTTNMTDIETVTITIPESGYILLMGQCHVYTTGNTEGDYIYVQIDETSGGSTTYPYLTRAGMGTYPNTNVYFFPIFVQRVIYKTAGTYTFRLEGMHTSVNHESQASSPSLTALYFPTSYEASK